MSHATHKSPIHAKAAAQAKAPTHAKEPGTFWSILGVISQVALTSLAAFGYFFTIRPIHQNQLLAERNSQLEIVGGQLRRTNAGLQALIENDKMQIADYSKDLEDLKKQLKLLRNEYALSVEENRSIAREVRDAKVVKQKLAGQLKESKDMYIVQSLLLFLVYNAMDSSFANSLTIDILNNSSSVNVNELLREIYGDPYAEMKKQVLYYFTTEGLKIWAPAIGPEEVEVAAIKNDIISILDANRAEIQFDYRTDDSFRNIVFDYREKQNKLSVEKEAIQNNESLMATERYRRLAKINNDIESTEKATIKALNELKQPMPFKIFVLILGKYARGVGK